MYFRLFNVGVGKISKNPLDMMKIVFTYFEEIKKHMLSIPKILIKTCQLEIIKASVYKNL